jgi:Fe2+ or Zn2+ uptake regulation protein
MVDGYGLKMTPQRRAIVEYLQTCTDHPTADEVLTAVNDKFPMTSRPTVYNTLNWLKGSGLVNEVYEEAPSATTQTLLPITILFAVAAASSRI